jgi:hypothetical protein
MGQETRNVTRPGSHAELIDAKPVYTPDLDPSLPPGKEISQIKPSLNESVKRDHIFSAPQPPKKADNPIKSRWVTPTRGATAPNGFRANIRDMGSST